MLAVGLWPDPIPSLPFGGESAPSQEESSLNAKGERSSFGAEEFGWL